MPEKLVRVVSGADARRLAGRRIVVGGDNRGVGRRIGGGNGVLAAAEGARQGETIGGRLHREFCRKAKKK